MMAFAFPTDGSSWATKSTGKAEGVISQLFKLALSGGLTYTDASSTWPNTALGVGRREVPPLYYMVVLL